MKIAIFGLGYVGFTAACCIASEGHEVVGVDVSDEKINDINDGAPPFEEPGLKELMTKAKQIGSLYATKSISDALSDTDIAIVCVGTPSAPDGSHDMSYIIEVTRQIAESLSKGNQSKITVAFRSTMRPGSIRKLILPIFESILEPNFNNWLEVVYNPEFLREASAINDYFHPSKIVIGTLNGSKSELLESLHENIDATTFYSNYEEAEITKFVDNTWHATKVTFANEIGRLCKKIGISSEKVHEIFVSDTKLNISPYYMRPGGAFGGSCLPKDTRALQYISSDVGANTCMLDTLLRSNEAHKNFHYEQVMSKLSGNSKVLMAGLAFKSNTDDLRESPNVDLARKLLSSGVDLKIFDPALDPVKLKGKNLGFVYSNIPSIDRLLVGKEEANKGDWDLVIKSNDTANMIDDKYDSISTHTIS
jgi:GDP-mannose 6-dehydrogenase